MLMLEASCQGDKVVKMNIDGVDASIEGIVECEVPAAWASLAIGKEVWDKTKGTRHRHDVSSRNAM